MKLRRNPHCKAFIKVESLKRRVKLFLLPVRPSEKRKRRGKSHLIFNGFEEQITKSQF